MRRLPDSALVVGHGEKALCQSQRADDHRRWRRPQRPPSASMENRTAKAGERVAYSHHGLPPAARHQQMWRVLLCRVVQATCRLSHFLSERFADSVGCTTPHNRDGFLGPKCADGTRTSCYRPSKEKKQQHHQRKAPTTL